MLSHPTHAFAAGRTALVTGGSDGIGLEIARWLALAGARVLLPVRNREKGERAAARIRESAPGARLELLDLDLARLDSVAALVSELRDAGEPIELAVLNAGIVQLGERRRSVTVDGFELAFQTNCLGHFALALGILPLLRACGARIAVQGSVAAAGARLRWGDLQGAQRYGAFRAYRSSKLALGLFGVELARRSAAEGWGLGVQLCHPGIAPGSAIAPALRALLPPELVRTATAYLGNPPRQAALTALAALAAPPTASPRMFVPAGPFGLAGPPRERAPFAELERAGDARLLWELAARWAPIRP
ncbi:MAG: SDR family NAD(P)-dependent oxidoreductase [Candidatus Leucobacter sulfamidivorax]|nr:SDR family NAD(P)-dependent oxidoreductase [Candidatus Leucobacter sulfamidivorax]